MLLVHASTDPHSTYSRYLAEILRMEGFADFDEADLASLNGDGLSGHDLVIMPRLTTTVAQAGMLAAYLEHGGKLLAFQPDDQIVRRLGIIPTFHAIASGYLHRRACAELDGLHDGPVQVVVPVASWAVDADASAPVAVLADVWSARRGASTSPLPGIVRATVGAGEAIVYAYDLPCAIARLRQGDPDKADVCFSSIDGIYRGADLITEQLDESLKTVPQADVQTALLARLIETLAPRPRIWYYPEARERSVIVMTSDDDWSTVEQFEVMLASLRQRNATCTYYIVPGTKISNEQMSAWEQDGHTFSVHPALESDYRRGTGPVEPQQIFTADMIRENVARHEREHGRTVNTIRNHCVRWLGYVAMARVQADLHARLDCNFVTVFPLALGYTCGSGRPLRFVDTDGSLVDCYQQPTLWTEECLINPAHGLGVKWTVERAQAETNAVIRAAARTFYTPVAINSHPVSFATYSQPLIESNWDTALAEGMRIVSADKWLQWTDTREAMRLVSDADGWTLRAPREASTATVLFPPGTESGVEQAETSTQTLWGRHYQALTLRDVAAGERRRIAARQAAAAGR